MRRSLSLLLGSILCGAPLAACGDDDRPAVDGGGEADAGPSDGGGTHDGGRADGGDAAVEQDGGVVGCPRTPAPADRVRRVVVSHPYAAGGGESHTYRVLELGTDGTLTVTDTTFEMGPGRGGTIAFTPDGAIGVAPQKNGTVGIFRVEEDGGVTVVESAYEGAFYAAAVIADPAGTHVWVLDAQWRESGGGIYRLALDCDGSVLEERLVAPAKLPYAMQLRPDGTALVGAVDVLGSAAGHDAHAVRLAGEPAVLGGADAFGDDDFIIAGSALTANGRHLLLGDNAAFSGVPNRVAVVAVDGDTLAPAQVLTPLEDPVSIVASPFDDAALVVSGFGDAIFRLDYDPEAAEPFALAGELAYAGTRPQLPDGAVLIDRGALEGLVLVAENVAVRRVRFDGGGAVTDLGATTVGAGLERIVGALGVQP